MAMRLTVRPDRLHGASRALARCGTDLADAGASFARRAAAEVDEIGPKLQGSSERAAQCAIHIVEVLSHDIAQLADALDALAVHYPRVDATAVRRR
jgi:hypothetical protein